MVKNLRNNFKEATNSNHRTPHGILGDPLILKRDQHCISRKNIDHFAIKVMRRLISSGYKAYLVGGSVRDLLLNKKPKDFDIGTDALPEEVRKLFRNSRIIGKRFKLVQVFFHGNIIFEVATFRSEETNESQDELSNIYGDPQSDALRRDLTINGLFYDLKSFAVIDYVGGIEDLKQGIIRIIGEPAERIKQDPVRMIRAVRHAARTSFAIEKQTLLAIKENAELITKASPARVYEELLREIKGGFLKNSLQLLVDTGLIKYLLPELSEMITLQGEEFRKFLYNSAAKIDKLITSGKSVETALIFLILYAGVLQLDIPDSFHLQPDVSKRVNLSLRKTIDSLFKPIGVPNKDRDQMLKILALCWEMIVSFVKEFKDKSIVRKRHFNSAMLLIKFYADDYNFNACYEHWKRIEIKQQRTQLAKVHKKRRHA